MQARAHARKCGCTNSSLRHLQSLTHTTHTEQVPTSYVSPCFAHIQSDTTARCLSKTQVALHLQKALLEKQALDAKQKEDGWEKRRAELVSEGVTAPFVFRCTNEGFRCTPLPF